MRKSSIRMFVLLVGLLVTTCVVAAGPHEVIGRVEKSSHASLGAVAVPSDGTILAGETLSTEKGGSALVKFGANAQADVGEQTAVVFTRNADGLAARVASGTLVVEASGPGAPVIETDEYKASPADSGRAIYLVAVMPDRGTSFTARRGRVSIQEIRSGKTYLLREGYTARAVEDPPAAPGQEKEQPKQEPSIPAGPATGKSAPAHKSHSTLIIALAGAAAAGAGVAVAAGGGGSGGTPASPSHP